MDSISNRNLWSAGAASLVLMALAAGLALAEVPQHMAFSGRLVDGTGAPLVGSVVFELWIYDDPTGGNALYGEGQNEILDAQGNFSVLLGTGSDLGTGPHLFDSTLFSGADRYVEVVLLEPAFAVLAPRVPIASVPWVLVAQQVAPWDPNATPRFEDCGDGTVADHQTGLQWEKKTGTVDISVSCDAAGCPDPHDVNNVYNWTNVVWDTVPNGSAFTNFLAKVNDPLFGAAASTSDVTGCFAGHCDWRLPNIVELDTIRDCSHLPCIDPIFGPTPTASSLYWSASSWSVEPANAWYTRFDYTGNGAHFKTNYNYVRGVRKGSCS